MRLNGNRTMTGILRGFDPYMNLVLDDCVEERSSHQKFNIGMVVNIFSILFKNTIHNYGGCFMSLVCSEPPNEHMP